MKYFISYKEAKEIEKFYKNKGDLTDKNGYKIIKGNNSNIMISCPHSVSQLRNGKIKVRENYIGVISELVQKHTNCHLIIKTRNMNDDVNFDKDSSYKDELVAYIKENNIKLIIDLHGCFSHKYDIEIGTYYGHNLSDKNIIKTIYNNFLDNNINSIILDKSKSSGLNTISYDIKKRANINTIQLEIGKKYRWPKTRIDSFNKMINALIDMIKELDGKKVYSDKNYITDFDDILNINSINYKYKENLVGLKMDLGVNYNTHDKQYIETLLDKIKKIVFNKGYFIKGNKVISDYSFSIVLKPMKVNELMNLYSKILKIIKNSKETIIYKTNYNSSLTLMFDKTNIEKYHKNLVNYLHENKNIFKKDKYTKLFKKSNYKVHLNKQDKYVGKYAAINYLNEDYIELRNIKLKINLDELKIIIIKILKILGGKNDKKS